MPKEQQEAVTRRDTEGVDALSAQLIYSQAGPQAIDVGLL